MYTIGIAQNHHPNALGPASETFYLTDDEQRIVIDQIGTGEHPEIIVVEEHGGGESHMENTSTLSYDEARRKGTNYYNIPRSKQIGRVVEALSDAEGNFHPVMQYYHENPRVREIMKEIKGGAKYGLSLGVDAEKLPGGRLQNKRLTHVGLTKMPEFGGDPALTYDPDAPKLFGTWLHQGAVSYDGMDEILEKHYFKHPGMYAAARTRDRLAERRSRNKTVGVPMSVGASRPRIDSPSLIQTSVADTPALFPAPSSSSAMTETTTTSSIPGFPLTTPVGELPRIDTVQQQQQLLQLQQQQQQQQAGERLRRAEQELEVVFNRERELIEKLDNSDPTKFVRAKTLQLTFQDLMNDAGVFSDPAKRTKYSSTLFKLDDYVSKAENAYDAHIDQSVLTDQERNVMKAMVHDPDVKKYGPILAQVGASAQSFNNFRLAEAQLQKEKEERVRLEEVIKKRDEELGNFKKRMSDFDEQSAQLNKRPSFANTALAPPSYSMAAATSRPEDGAVPTSVGATRYMGSTIARSEHRPVTTEYDDLLPRRDAFKYSPAARTVFNDDLQRILENVSALSQKYQMAKNTTADGKI